MWWFLPQSVKRPSSLWLCWKTTTDWRTRGDVVSKPAPDTLPSPAMQMAHLPRSQRSELQWTVVNKGWLSFFLPCVESPSTPLIVQQKSKSLYNWVDNTRSHINWYIDYYFKSSCLHSISYCFRHDILCIRISSFLPCPPTPSLSLSLSPSSHRGATGGRRVEQDVEQARPTDMSEEEMQLKLALQLSKQQAEEEEKLKWAHHDIWVWNCVHEQIQIKSL